MKKRFLSLLLVANAVVAGVHLTVAAPVARADEAGWADCCKHSTDGLGYCCDNCCWIDSCDSTTQCGDKQIA